MIANAERLSAPTRRRPLLHTSPLSRGGLLWRHVLGAAIWMSYSKLGKANTTHQIKTTIRRTIGAADALLR